jgi:hypothetical protein
LVVKLPLPLVEFVQIGVQLLSGNAMFVLVSRYMLPAPVFIAEMVRLVPEITGLAVNCRPVTTGGMPAVP